MLAGRHDQVREIVENCVSGRLVVLTAEPGMGVSTLLSLGVAPELRSKEYVTLIFCNSSGGREGQTKKPLRIFMLDLDLC